MVTPTRPPMNATPLVRALGDETPYTVEVNPPPPPRTQIAIGSILTHADAPTRKSDVSAEAPSPSARVPGCTSAVSSRPSQIQSIPIPPSTRPPIVQSTLA